MSEARRGRAHDAEGAREAILNAAEKVFAEHGFAGARIASIATVAGYNSSLIFQYFGDKFGLYVAVLKRIDKTLDELQARALEPLFEDENLLANARQFKALLKTIVQTIFDYLVAHPHFMRMLMWEMADGWQIFTKIMSELKANDDQLELFFQKAQSAGLIRSDFLPILQLSMILQVCHSYLAFRPLYLMILPEEDLSSAAALAQARTYIVNFIVAGLMVDPEEI